MSPDLNARLTELRRLLPSSLMLTVSVPLDFATSIAVEGGIAAFAQAVHAAQPPLVFVEWTHLSETDFAWAEKEDDPTERRRLPIPLGKFKPLQVYRKRLGQPRHLRVFFLLQGHQIEYAEEVSWWPEFEDAIDKAYEIHLTAEERLHESRSVKLREDSRRRIAILKERLPTDDAYIKLSCEPRLRITALRDRGGAVLKDALGSATITAMEDPTLRDIAADLREERRQAKKPKNSV